MKKTLLSMVLWLALKLGYCPPEREETKILKGVADGIKIPDLDVGDFFDQELQSCLVKKGFSRGGAYLQLSEAIPLKSTSQDTSPVVEPGNIAYRDQKGGVHYYDEANKDFQVAKVRMRNEKFPHGMYYDTFVKTQEIFEPFTSVTQMLQTGVWECRHPEFPKDAPDSLRNYAAEVSEQVGQNLFRELKGGWGNFLFESMMMLPMGFSLFHLQFNDKTKKLKRLQYIYPSSVEAWINDEFNVELLGVRILRVASRYGNTNAGVNRPALASSSDRTVDLPAQNTLMLTYQKLGSSWEGIPLLRPIFRYIQILQLACQIEAVALSRYGSPILEAQQEGPILDRSPEQVRANVKKFMEQLRALQDPVVVMPSGFKLVLHSPKNAMPDATPIKNYALERIRELMKSTGSMVGLGTTGSYAERVMADKEHVRTVPYFAGLINDALNGVNGYEHQGLIKKMVDYGYDIRKLTWGGRTWYPEMHFKVSDQEDPEFINRLDRLKQNGLVVPTKDLIKKAHKILQLPVPSDEEIEKHMSEWSRANEESNLPGGRQEAA